MPREVLIHAGKFVREGIKGVNNEVVLEEKIKTL